MLFAGLLAGVTLVNAEETEFSYAQGELFAYGQGQKETIDVAMCINNPTLVGMKITGIKAYTTCVKGLENTSLWLSKELTLVDKINVPDIKSFDVAPVETSMAGENLGLLSIELPEPYIITNDPVYIGYSMTVTETTDIEQKYPIILSEGTNPDGLFLHMSKSVLKWMNYNIKAGGVAYIVVTLEGEFSEYALAIRDSGQVYVMEDEEYNIELQVSNSGSHPVENLKYTYSYDDSDKIYEGSATLPTPIEADMTQTWPVTLSLKGVSGIGRHILNLNITEIDGNPNNSPLASTSCLVNVMPYKPKHRPLIEEFTGLWCGWCPRGFVAMEKLSEDFGDDIVAICYHNKDEMAVTSVYPVPEAGFPSSTLNRTNIMDPYYGTYNADIDFGVVYDVENSMNEMTMADIQLETVLNGSTVEVKSSTTFMIDIDDCDYEVGYVLVANGLKYPTWVQKNFYAGLESEYTGTFLEEICSWPQLVAGLTFNDVVIDVSGMMGVANSIPATVKTAVPYVHDFSFDIEGNSLVQDTDNLVVCAFVIDKSTGFIVNANKCKINSSGIEKIEGRNEVTETEYYDLTGRRVSHPESGIMIKREKLSDGTIRSEKVIIR